MYLETSGKVEKRNYNEEEYMNCSYNADKKVFFIGLTGINRYMLVKTGVL